MFLSAFSDPLDLTPGRGKRITPKKKRHAPVTGGFPSPRETPIFSGVCSQTSFFSLSERSPWRVAGERRRLGQKERGELLLEMKEKFITAVILLADPFMSPFKRSFFLPPERGKNEV